MGPGPEYMAPSSQFFFANSNLATSLIDFLPARAVADRLLQQYWLSVHPIARILHKPSFLKRYELFWAEVTMGIEPAGSLQAIVFSTMFSAVVSMPQDVLLHYFGVGKKEMVANFQIGTETALGRANFIRTSKVETLQAFVMYLVSDISVARRSYSPKDPRRVALRINFVTSQRTERGWQNLISSDF